jgi:hypothetical protein
MASKKGRFIQNAYRLIDFIVYAPHTELLFGYKQGNCAPFYKITLTTQEELDKQLEMIKNLYANQTADLPLAKIILEGSIEFQKAHSFKVIQPMMKLHSLKISDRMTQKTAQE